MTLMTSITAAALLCSSAWRLIACPYCESAIGREVRAAIFSSDFALNAALTLMPIPILLLFVGLLHFGIPWPRHLRTKSKRADERRHAQPIERQD